MTGLLTPMHPPLPDLLFWTLGNNNELFGQHSLTGVIKGKQHQDDKKKGGGVMNSKCPRQITVYFAISQGP